MTEYLCKYYQKAKVESVRVLNDNPLGRISCIKCEKCEVKVIAQRAYPNGQSEKQRSVTYSSNDTCTNPTNNRIEPTLKKIIEKDLGLVPLYQT